MTDKKSTDEMEADLRKMLGKEPQQKVREMTNTHEIEADLKRMLNMSQAVVVTKEDLLSIKSAKETKKPPVKKKEKKKHHPEVDHHHHRQHQEEPFSAVTPDGSQPVGKKKNKKPRKKKIKDATSLIEEKEKEKKDSEDSEAEDSRPKSHKQFNLDFHRAKYLDDQLTQAILNELESERIFPLKKKSAKFTNAKYFCRLCEYHCDNIQTCRQHANDKRHRRRKEIMLQDKMLKNLPLPSERHVEALDGIVENIYKQHGLTDEELNYRQTVVNQIQDLLREKLQDVSLCIFGSSINGLEQFKDVKSDFQAKVPSVLFTSPCGSLQCQITVGNQLACQTSQYLAIYSQLDERLRKLAVTFKYWAKVCEVDSQDRGSLPAYCFGLMTIFYLQQIQPPVLPVLWKDLSEQALKRPKTKEDVQNMFAELKQEVWSSNNEHAVGTLWKDMLMFYGVHFDLAENIICVRSLKVIPRAEKKWKSRRVAIEDPFSSKRNVARSLQNLRMFDYFYNCLRKAGLYFSLPTSHQNLSKYYESKRKTSHKAKENEKQSRLQHTGSDVSAGQTGSVSKTETIMHVDENIGTIPKEETNKMKEQVSDCERKQDECIADIESDSKLESDLLNDEEISSDCSIKENKFLEECKLNFSEQESSSSKGETDNDKGGEDLVPHLEKLAVQEEENVEARVDLSKDCALNKSQDVIIEKCKHDSLSDCDIVENDNQTKIDGAVQGGVSSVSKCTNCETVQQKVIENSNGENIEDSHSECLKCETLEHKDDPSNVTENNENEVINYETNLEGSNVAFDERTSTSCSEEKQDHVSLGTENASVIVADVVDSVIKSVIDHSRAETEENDHVVENKIETDENVLAEKELEDITGCEVDGGGEVSDTSSGLSSDNDMEAESPDSSPLLKRKKRVSSPVGAEYEFKFDSHTLTDGKGPSVFCPICEKEGHLKSSCPEDQLPNLKKLPPVTKTHLHLLTSVITGVPKDFKLSNEEINDREFVRRNLEVHIQGLYPDAQLRLFGSSMNGFGFHQSDLDICVTFKDKDPEDINFVEHIEAICKSLKTHRGLYAVFPITTAKVPIVKFKHRNSQLEGDISLYNILAMENTRLLHAYANIDQRVQTLGYAIKVFAKVCDIGDASRGSLSSYAYMLMMIHYLQHTKPPVVPVLQELHTGDGPKPERIVEGWNTWFFDDISKLPYIWPECGQNNQCVGELWLGFFRYYLEEFNFAEQVVTIRQFEPLTKFEKLWNGKCIAIEDPFDLGHNLGGGLTRKMNHYIQCTCVNARELYGTCIKGKPEGFNTIQDYFFDQSQLVDGEPPSDRLCRVCGKIGHIARECPRLIAKKEREAAERKRKEDMKKAEQDGVNGSPQHNMGPRHFQNRDRQNTQRSVSDPVNGGSPVRGQGHQQFYKRQNSQPSQSPDSIQMRPLLNIPVPDRYNGNYQGPRSPHRDFQQHYGSNRRPQSNSPRTHTAQGHSGYRQQGYRNQQNQQYYPDNHNDNSSQRFHNQGQGQNRNRNGPQYFVNQNYDLRSQQNAMQQGDSINYPSSPTGHRNRPPFRNQYYEGSPQVFVSSGNPESDGLPRVLFTNPPFNIPVNVFSSMPPMFVNSSMAVNHAYQPLVPLATSSSMVNFQNNGVPVSAPGWFPAFVPLPVFDEQPAAAGQKTSTEQEVSSEQVRLQETEQLSKSPLSAERKVSVQKSGNREKVPDFGVTVKNEYYSNKD
ncbi:terminal uridylyltransferase 7-like [Mercenaria mercenaria]|uniref:terminal uridylyltransferase 7-like n=1 Tax=Mercenaria mercenaria TaxID=6596 RepID=UPI00234EA42C|nr:terminal uridylyltransferase 7-like [Mercenaria mercenaria]